MSGSVREQDGSGLLVLVFSRVGFGCFLQGSWSQSGVAVVRRRHVTGAQRPSLETCERGKDRAQA